MAGGGPITRSRAAMPEDGAYLRHPTAHLAHLAEHMACSAERANRLVDPPASGIEQVDDGIAVPDGKLAGPCRLPFAVHAH